MMELKSPDAQVRASAVRSLCPCHAGWEVFEQNIGLIEQLKKDPCEDVRASALHVFEDAGEMQSGGYPTNPREMTNEMLRTKRASRFRPDAEDVAAAQKAKTHRHRNGRSK